MSKFQSARSRQAEALNEAISRAAALWVVRSDRGLTGTELAEFEQWLAADVRHRKAMPRSTAIWGLLDRMPGDLASRCDDQGEKIAFPRHLILAIAAAATVAIASASWWQIYGHETQVPVSVASNEATARTLLLSDGTLVSLNSGAEILEKFTASRRRVVLLKGEAHFNVKKNAAWPFAVRAGNSEVVAVGTAFDVNLQLRQIEVVVTEGRVRVASNVSGDTAFESASPGDPMVRAGQQALISRRHFFSPSTVEVSDCDPLDMARILSWKNPLTTLTGATLGDLAEDFRKRIGYRLVFADPEVASLRIGGRFRVNDVEDFVRLLADNFGLEANHIGQNETVLRLRK
jgi:transmembrane sensor